MHGLALLLSALLAAGSAAALEPGDLVVGVGTDLYRVEPDSGASERLSEGPGAGVVRAVTARSDGVVFFSQTSFLTATTSVWRFDPERGERRELFPLGPGGDGLALDERGQLVTAVADASPDPGSQPELVWLDAGTGEPTRVFPLSPGILGITDLAFDPAGRVLLSSSRAGLVRLDPRTGALEILGASQLRASQGRALAVEADGSILVAGCCPPKGVSPRSPLVGAVFTEGPLPPPVPRPLPTLGPSLFRIDPERGTAQSVSTGGLLGDPTGLAVEADGGIVVSSRPDPRSFGPASVLRVDPDDGSQTLLTAELPDASAIAVVPQPPARIELRPSVLTLGTDSRRVLSVRLFGSEHLDAGDVDLASLAFGPAGAAPLRSRFVRRGRGRGFPQLLLFFRAAETGLRAGDTQACLSGTAGGRAFRGCDAVRVREISSEPALAAGDLVVAVGNSLFVVDPQSGEVGLLAPDPFFGPLPFGSIRAVAIAPGGGELFFAVQGFGTGFDSLWRLDPETGQRVLLAGADLELLNPRGVVLEPGGSLLVLDVQKLLRVDPATGARQLLVQLDFLRSGLLPTGLVREGALGAWVSARRVFGGEFSGVLRIDLENMSSATLAGRFSDLTGLAREADGSLVVTSRSRPAPTLPPVLPGESLIRIDPDTGAASLISQGGLLLAPNGLAVETDGRIAVLDGGGPDHADAVIRIDPRDGGQTLLTEIPALGDASAIAVVPRARPQPAGGIDSRRIRSSRDWRARTP